MAGNGSFTLLPSFSPASHLIFWSLLTLCSSKTWLSIALICSIIFSSENFKHTFPKSLEVWISVGSDFPMSWTLWLTVWALTSNCLVSNPSLPLRGASQVVQWWRICLPVRETWVQSLISGISHSNMEQLSPLTALLSLCLDPGVLATKVCALEPVIHNKRATATRSPHTTAGALTLHS